MRVLAGMLRTLRLALPKIGVGWMFALLLVNFNRIAIVELGITAVLITAMTGMHHFLSPFQVVFGRFADQHPIFGFRRTPILLVASVAASLLFVLLPALALAMGGGSGVAILGGFGLFALFGIAIAAMGDAHHSLIADVTPERSRSSTMAFVWTLLIISTIASAIVMKVVMPVYTPQAMQTLYNLTPLVVIGSVLLGVLGVERRLRGDEVAAAVARSKAAAPKGNPLRGAASVLRHNGHARAFFAFVFLAILGIFIQETIREVFGGEVFKLSPKETASFQIVWGGGALASMLLVGGLGAFLPISKKLLATIGGAGTILGLGLLTLAALTVQQSLVNPALLVMGVGVGIFNVGALSMMMDMTVDGATGLYMGLWGMAQAFGQGIAAILAGGFKSLLIETGLLSGSLGFTMIFGVETVIMIVAVGLLRTISVEAFRGQTSDADVRQMAPVSAVGD